MGDLSLFIPEAVALLGVLVAFAMSAFGASARATWATSVVLATAALGASAAMLGAEGEPFFPGIYRVDLFSQVLKIGITLGLTLTLLISRNLGSVRHSVRVDMPIFLFMSTLGLMMLVSATELLTLYVSLELSAYGLYIMVALHRRRHMASESATKYVMFGNVASATTLYGLSLVYGASGTTYVAEIMAQPAALGSPLFLVGLALMLSGFFFKLGLFPFHSWAPDAYQGAPHQAATFIGTASKVGAVGVLIRALGLAEDPSDLVPFLLALSVLSMTVGNLAALVQKDLKRLLGWSTVAHAGYILTGALAFSTTGMAAAIFYVLIYVVVAFCAFLVACRVGADGSNPSIESLSGLYQRSPFLAFLLLLGMFGLAGIPPTPGFAGKWFLFSAALEAGLFWLVLAAAVNATISLYYYLMIVKAAYLTPPGDHPEITVSPAYALAGGAAIGLVVVTGFYPGPLWDLALEAAQVVTGG